MRALAVALLFSTVAPATLHAQLTNIPSDTIVRLAVDPARYQGQIAVTLLDEAVHRIEPDGKSVTEARQVMQVLAEGAVRGFAERGFTWSPSHQVMTLKWVRVLKPTGEVLSEKPAQEQDSDVAAQLQNPIYQERKQKRISLAGVAANTIIDMAWTIEEKGPYRSGDFLFNWSFDSRFPTVHSRFVIDVPESFEPRLEERNLVFRRTEETAAGRRRIQWARSHAAAYTPARYEPDSNGITMSVTVTPPSTWSEIGKWYDGLARDRYTLSPAVTQRVDSIVRASGARTRLDTIRAVHRWVAQDIRYVSVSLGLGGYQPRTPNDVLTTGFGDCKDKATIFIAALRRYRMPTNPVILSINGRANGRAPSMFQFDHVIAAVGDGANRVYTDLTADLVPYGELPDSYAGSFAIVVRPDGAAEEVRLPLMPTDSNVSIMRLNLVMDTSGTLRGRVEQEARGGPSHSMRNFFTQPLDTARRAMFLRTVSQGLFPNAGSGDSLVAFDGRDLQAPTRLSFVITASGALRPVGDSRILSLPPFIRGNASGYANLARQIESAPVRQTPVDASRVLGMLVTITDVRITLPAGWKAELPKNVLATSFFGSYESTWTQEGNTVRLLRRIHGLRGIHPPQRITEVATWMKATGADSYEFLTLKPTGTP